MGFSLRQFSEVFKVRDPDGKPYVLVGGQAVNYWAERYLPTEPELNLLQPFTSEDIDFKGGRGDVERIAQQLDLSPSYPPKMAITALSGLIAIRIGEGKSFIEVVRLIPGLSGDHEPPAVEVVWEGKMIRVLDPISLLACKLELVARVSQDGRHDVAHLKILLPSVRAFLDEFLKRVELGEIPAKHWLGAANQVLKLTTRDRAVKIGKEHRINWREILPLAAIAKSKNEKIRRFHEQQLDHRYVKPKGTFQN